MKHAHALLSVLALLGLGLASRAQDATQSDALAGARRRWEALAPDEQARMKARWEHYQALPENEQRELKARAQVVQDLRQRAARRLPVPLRERVQQLPEPQRGQILSELLELEMARIGARMRAVLPPDVVQELERARPDERAKFFADYQVKQRVRVTRYMIERLGKRLGLAPEEIERLKHEPEAQGAARVLELRQRLTQAEGQEFGLPPGLTQEKWQSLLALPPEEFFERLADHVRDRQLAGAEAGIGSGGARPAGVSAQGLPRLRALRRLQEASQADPADLVELADETPQARREQVAERTRERCLRILSEDQLISSEELEHWRNLNGPAFAGAVEKLIAPLLTRWRPPADEKR